MAGLWVTVCLPARAQSDLLAAIGEAMAPFETSRVSLRNVTSGMSGGSAAQVTPWGSGLCQGSRTIHGSSTIHPAMTAHFCRVFRACVPADPDGYSISPVHTSRRRHRLVRRGICGSG